MAAKFYEDIGWHGGIQAITFLAINQFLKMLCHFEVLTLQSMGKPKM